jgi:hypothetical protein
MSDLCLVSAVGTAAHADSPLHFHSTRVSFLIMPKKRNAPPIKKVKSPSPKTVKASRLKERSATCAERLAWNADQLALLGTAPDAEVAAAVGVNDSAIHSMRKRYGIPSFGQNREKLAHAWTKKQLSWFGKLPDAEIARRVGLNTATVSVKRRCLGIETKSKPSGRQWSEKELKLLGTDSDVAIGKKLGLGRRTVRLKRTSLGIPNAIVAKSESLWTEEVRRRLGKVPDKQIAKELKISVSRVSSYRLRHRILFTTRTSSGRTK